MFRILGFRVAALIAICFGGLVVTQSTASAWSPDRTFGEQGTIDSEQDVHGMTIDGAGRLVVVGQTGGKYRALAGARFNPDGSVDRNFGIVGGNYNLDGLAVDIDSKARIVVAGFGTDFMGGRIGPALFRFLPNGKRDKHFEAKTAFPGFRGYGYSDVSALKDGGILVVGSRESDRSAILIRKFRSSGEPDRRFGNKGTVTVKGPKGESGTTGATNMKLLGGGKFLVSGVFNDRPWVGRFKANGLPDRSFGHRGSVTAPIKADSGCVIFRSCAAFGLAVTARQEIRVLANESTGNRYTAHVVGFRRDGSRDTSFGRNGILKMSKKHFPFGGTNLVGLPGSTVGVLGGNMKFGLAVSVSDNGRTTRVAQRFGGGANVTAGRLAKDGSLYLAASGDIRKLVP